jgi:hypothetical protein
MFNSDMAIFHIRLIPAQWYNDIFLALKKNLQSQFAAKKM